MAKVAKNMVLHGASGKIGDQIVIRQRGDTTVLAQAPGKRTTDSTEDQVAHQGKFQEAVLYGRSVVRTPSEKAEYQEKADENISAFNLAVADFFHAPAIDEIDLTNYSGQAGDSIRVRAIDDFKVVQVHVAIYNADGSLVEEGDAVKQANELDWTFTATVVNESTDGDRIVIRAYDKPAHVAQTEKTL
jgi:hypothetical protein